MRHCSNCGGGSLRSLRDGGCGGRGATYGCPKCDSVFQQTTGGILPTHGGEQYQRVRDAGYKETLVHLAKRIEPRRMDQEWNKKEPDYGKWQWAEVGYGKFHTHDTEKEAKEALATYVDKLEVAAGYPDCDQCGKRMTRYGLSYVYFKCGNCHRHYQPKEKKWFTADWEKDE